MNRRYPRITVESTWAITRIATLVTVLGFGARVVGDIGYYYRGLTSLGEHGLSGTFPEYPLAALVVIGAPALLTLGHAELGGYGILFIFTLVAVDWTFFRILRTKSITGDTAAILWLWAVPALGLLAYARFDLVPGVLVGCAILLNRQRPRTAMVLMALATCLKLWPVLLFLPLLSVAKHGRMKLAGVYFGTGLGVVAFTILFAGVGRVVSPLTYQSTRGLQVESLFATPAMLFRWRHPGRMWVWYAPSNSEELLGPGVKTLLFATSLATILLLGVLVCFWFWALTGPTPGTNTISWLALASATGVVATSRVLSPQYLLWILPAAIAATAIVRSNRTLLRWTTLLLVTSVLTQLIFPVLYGPLLMSHQPNGFAVGILTARNVLFTGLTITAFRMAWVCRAREWVPRWGPRLALSQGPAHLAAIEVMAPDRASRLPGRSLEGAGLGD